MYSETVCQDNICKIDLEGPEPGILFVHCEVYDKSKTALKIVKERLLLVKEEAYFGGLNELFARTLNKRFAKFVDPSFKSLGEVGYGHRKQEVLVWDLTP